MGWFSRAIDKEVKSTVEKTIDKYLQENLPRVIEKYTEEYLDKNPDQPLSQVGFSWALAVALRRHWPELSLKEASRWMWDYVDVPFGSKGYSWNYSAAKELAHQYVLEHGETR